MCGGWSFIKVSVLSSMIRLMQSLPDSVQRLESCIERLEGRMNRGVSDFSLGAHNESVDFKHVLNTLCNMISDVCDFVKNYKQKFSLKVMLIKNAVKNARDSVLYLYVQFDDDWEKIVSAIVTLHDTM